MRGNQGWSTAGRAGRPKLKSPCDNKVKMAELEEDVKHAVARHNRMMEDAKSNRELDKERKAEMAEA